MDHSSRDVKPPQVFPVGCEGSFFLVACWTACCEQWENGLSHATQPYCCKPRRAPS